MKKGFISRIIIIVILLIILSIMLFFYFRTDNESNITNGKMQMTMQDAQNMENAENMDDTVQEDTNSESTTTNSASTSTATTTKIASTTTEVSSGLTETLELHATYYLEECYVEEGDLVSEGDNILQYTNGTYLTAPYDCIINSLNIPDEEEQCTNAHNINISSNNQLSVSFSVDESSIDEFYVGQTATIEITALDDVEIEGYITSISNTASNGNFTVVVEFQNNGEIKIGMTASVTVYG